MSPAERRLTHAAPKPMAEFVSRRVPAAGLRTTSSPAQTVPYTA